MCAALLIFFLNQSEIGNWFKKSDYAGWSILIEEGLKAKLVNVISIDFATTPQNKDEFYVVVDLAEPTYEYEMDLLFSDVQRIILDAYLKTDPKPTQLDSMATNMHGDSGLIIGVITPFQVALDYIQAKISYDEYLDSWRYGVDFLETPSPNL